MKLCEKPSSIEHIYDIREWMETVPMAVRSLEEQAKRYLLVRSLFSYLYAIFYIQHFFPCFLVCTFHYIRSILSEIYFKCW